MYGILNQLMCLKSKILSKWRFIYISGYLGLFLIAHVYHLLIGLLNLLNFNITVWKVLYII